MPSSVSRRRQACYAPLMRSHCTESQVHDPERAERKDEQADKLDESDRSQLVERLDWTPRERLRYLVDMIAFEQRARRARRL